MSENAAIKEKIIGTVSLESGEYFLELPRSHRAKVQGAMDKILLGRANEAELKGLEGAKVEVLLSEPKSFVAGLVYNENDGSSVPKFKKILCYVPKDDFLKNITVNPEVIKELTVNLVKQKIFSSEVSAILNAKTL